MTTTHGHAAAGKAVHHGAGKRWILLGVLILLAFAAIQWLPIGPWIEGLRSWIEARGALGPILFVAIYIIAGLLFVPASALTLAAGAVFGVGLGLGLVSFAATAVATLAFLIARHVAHYRFEKLARKQKKFGAISRAISAGGWKMILLLRLSPVVPFNLLNYLLGLTRVELGPYVLASWIGMLPGTFLYVYLGHVGAEGARGRTKSPGEWALLGAGLVATVVAAIWIARASRKALGKRAGIERSS